LWGWKRVRGRSDDDGEKREEVTTIEFEIETIIV